MAPRPPKNPNLMYLHQKSSKREGEDDIYLDPFKPPKKEIKDLKPETLKANSPVMIR